MNKKTVFSLLLLTILLIGTFLRFVNYDNRWTLSQDQARDAIIGLIIFQTQTLPLVGPPSSIGQFSFGPYYYWLISLFSAIAPEVINAPWIGFTFFSLIPILLFYLIGKALKDQIFGLILAFLTATSCAFVFHSVDMLNPIPVSWFSTLALLCTVLLVEKKKLVFAFLLGLSIGLASNFHYQSLGLITLPMVAALIANFSRQKKLALIGLAFLGVILAFLPLAIFNIQVGGALGNGLLGFSSGSNFTLRSILGLFKDLVVFWPQLWGEVLVFKVQYGYLFYGLVVGISLWAIWQRKNLPQSWWVIVISLAIQAVALRIYGGVRAPIYLLVFHPFIIFLTGFAIWMLWQRKKLFGAVFLGIFIILSSYENFYIIKGHTQKPLIYEIKKLVDEKHTGSIDLYSTKDSGMISLPIYYLLLKENRVSPQGYRIGACANRLLENGQSFCPSEPPPFFGRENYSAYDLNTLESSKFEERGFSRLTNEEITGWLYDYYEVP